MLSSKAVKLAKEFIEQYPHPITDSRTRGLIVLAFEWQLQRKERRAMWYWFTLLFSSTGDEAPIRVRNG